MAAEFSTSADLEIGDTAGLETGATVRVPRCALAAPNSLASIAPVWCNALTVIWPFGSLAAKLEIPFKIS
jgi:hypothetical protein